MALEFNCPYCSVAIRVPDQHAGKRGKCPKCETQLIVPSLPTPPAAQPATQHPTAPTAAPTAPAPPTGDFPPAGNPGTVDTGPVFGPPDADSTIIPPQPESQITEAVPTVTPAAGSGSVSRRLRRKTRRRGSQQLLMWLIPVVCLGAFLGVIAVVTNLQTPELKGSLRGSRALKLELPPAVVSRSLLQLSDEQKVEVVAAFASGPESFVSPQMVCRIAVTEGSLTVELTPGEGFAWFGVNPGNNLPLMDWIRDHRESLNQSRVNWLSRAVTELAEDKLQKASGQPVQFAAIEYRNGVGVNAHVKAFGYVIEAIADDKQSLGFHEDSNGTVYFALPEDTQSFVIRGRTINGQQLFPGEYTVKVSAAAADEDAASNTDSSAQEDADGAEDTDAPPGDGMMPDDGATDDGMDSGGGMGPGGAPMQDGMMGGMNVTRSASAPSPRAPAV